MPTYNVKQIYLGRFESLDTIESAGDGSADNYVNEKDTVPGFEVGTVFDNKKLRIIDITQNDTVWTEGNGTVHSTRLESDDLEDTGQFRADSFSYDLGGGAGTSKIDTSFEWMAEIKWGDGTDSTLKIAFIQLQNGDIFIQPGKVFVDKKIQSITLKKFLDSDNFGSEHNQTVRNTEIVCFASGTRIKTSEGERKIEDLIYGDQVLTMDMGYRPITWIGSRYLDSADLSRGPQLRPIRIRANALGSGHPNRDLLVSPQHRLLIRNPITQKMFGANEILVAAKHLCGLDGIEVADDLEEVCYFHILFDRHQVVWSNGAASESLYIGPEAVKALTFEQRAEIFALFPEMCPSEHTESGEFRPFAFARQVAKGRRLRNMIARMARNKHNVFV